MIDAKPPPRWPRECLWALIIVLWLGCLAASVEWVRFQLRDQEAYDAAPASELSDCRLLAPIGDSMPDLAECERNYNRAMLERATHRRAAWPQMAASRAGLAATLMVAVVGALWCPRRLRPGWRAWLIAGVVAAALSAAFVLMLLTLMPRLGALTREGRRSA